MARDIAKVPVVGEDVFFVTCEEERLRAVAEARSGGDQAAIFEATMMVTHLFQWQVQSVGEMMEALKEMSAYDPRRDALRDWISAWTDTAGVELEQWAEFQNSMVDHIGHEGAEQIALTRVKPRLEGVRDRARAILRQQGRDLEGSPQVLMPDEAQENEPTLGEATLAPPTPSSQPMNGTKVCPDCAEEVKEAARKCRFCGYRFDSEPA